MAALSLRFAQLVEIDLIHKGIKTLRLMSAMADHAEAVEIDLIHKGIKTRTTSASIPV